VARDDGRRPRPILDFERACDFAGLRTVRSEGSFVDKPALAAYRRVARSLRAATR
jgi:hypothetical protein